MRTNMTTLAAPAAAMTLVKGALIAGVLLAFAPSAVLAADVPDKGTTPYVTHFIFRPLQSIDIPELGTATVLEAVGTTENMKGEKMLDKMSARCTALSVDSGPRNISTAPVSLPTVTATRFSRPSIPAISTSPSPRWIAAGTLLPAAPANMPGSPAASRSPASPCPTSPDAGSYTAMDIPHNTTWEIKK